MVMKAHSYIRTKLLYIKKNPYMDFEFRGMKVLNVTPEEEYNNKGKEFKISIREADIFGEMKKLSYFFFCPSLIYRDSYVLTPVRSFRRMIAHLLNFLACCYYGTHLITQP